jgi:hypothetical protein
MSAELSTCPSVPVYTQQSDIDAPTRLVRFVPKTVITDPTMKRASTVRARSNLMVAVAPC